MSNYLKKILIFLLVLMMPHMNSVSNAMDENEVRRGMTMRLNEGARLFDERVRQEHANQIHQARMVTHNQELVENAGRGFQNLHVALNNNRWIWYSGFAGLGAGLWLTTAFGGPGELEAGTAWFMAGGVVASVVAGGVSKCLIKNCCDVDVDTCMTNTWVNLTGGLMSFIPWIGFAITTALM